MRPLTELLRPAVSAAGRRARKGLEIDLLHRQIQGLEIDSLHRRIEGLERRLGEIDQHVEAARWPHGPVYAGNGTAIVATRWGAKLYVDCGDVALAPWLLLDGLWEASVTSWFHRVVRPGHHVVDVGANIGYFSVLAAKLVGPTGRVVGFEPHPGLRPLAARNLAANALHGHAEVRERAAWSETAELTFHVRESYAGNSSITPMHANTLDQLADTERAVPVQAVALDDELAGFGPVDVLKIDVEGAEVRALRGLRKTLEANPDVLLLCEWAPAGISALGDDPEELIDLFCSLGRSATVLGDDGVERPVGWDEVRSTPFANLLVAAR